MSRHKVVPLVGTWIEILTARPTEQYPCVVPLVGTWIEIISGRNRSFFKVVPLVGTWIEISTPTDPPTSDSRAPRGHVD